MQDMGSAVTACGHLAELWEKKAELNLSLVRRKEQRFIANEGARTTPAVLTQMSKLNLEKGLGG